MRAVATESARSGGVIARERFEHQPVELQQIGRRAGVATPAAHVLDPQLPARDCQLFRHRRQIELVALPPARSGGAAQRAGPKQAGARQLELALLGGGADEAQQPTCGKADRSRPRLPAGGRASPSRGRPRAQQSHERLQRLGEQPVGGVHHAGRLTDQLHRRRERPRQLARPVSVGMKLMSSPWRPSAATDACSCGELPRGDDQRHLAAPAPDGSPPGHGKRSAGCRLPGALRLPRRRQALPRSPE